MISRYTKILVAMLGIFLVGFGGGVLIQIAYELNVLKSYEWPENNPPVVIN